MELSTSPGIYLHLHTLKISFFVKFCVFLFSCLPFCVQHWLRVSPLVFFCSVACLFRVQHWLGVSPLVIMCVGQIFCSVHGLTSMSESIPLMNWVFNLNRIPLVLVFLMVDTFWLWFEKSLPIPRSGRCSPLLPSKHASEITVVPTVLPGPI